MFQDGEYVGTVALAENGVYGEGAEPTLPPGLLDEFRAAVGRRAFHSRRRRLQRGPAQRRPRAGRSARPCICRPARRSRRAARGRRDAAHDLSRRSPRSQGATGQRVIYVGLSGPAATVDCYAFEMSDGGYRCFTNGDAAPAVEPPAGRRGRPTRRCRRSARPGASARSPTAGRRRPAGLLPPIRGAPITSLFGMRFHPILHIVRLHAGIDFGAPVGSQVRAAADGDGRKHGRRRAATAIASCSNTPASKPPTTTSPRSTSRSARRCRQGEIIALSGNSGLSTGPHLHFEYRVNGVPADPLPHLGKEFQGRAAGDPRREPAGLPRRLGSGPADVDASGRAPTPRSSPPSPPPRRRSTPRLTEAGQLGRRLAAQRDRRHIVARAALQRQRDEAVADGLRIVAGERGGDVGCRRNARSGRRCTAETCRRAPSGR